MEVENDLDKLVAAYQGNNIYDFDNKILLEWYPYRVLEKCGNDVQSILELGVGHGFTTNIFSQHFDRHVVLDGSPKVIQNFKERFPDCTAEIIETYFEDFDSDERFDVIVIGFVLEHVDDPVKLLKHFRRFLNKNGKIFISVPNAEVLNRRLGKIAGLLSDFTELSEHDKLLGHQRYYTVSTFEEDIVSSGYSMLNIEGLYLKPFTTAQMLSLNLDETIINALCKAGIDYPELSCGLLAEVTVNEGFCGN